MMGLQYFFESLFFFSIIAGPAEVGVLEMHVHPLSFGDTGTKFPLDFTSLHGSLSVVQTLILTPCTDPKLS